MSGKGVKIPQDYSPWEYLLMIIRDPQSHATHGGELVEQIIQDLGDVQKVA